MTLIHHINDQIAHCMVIHADYELIMLRDFYPLLHGELHYDIKIELRTKINSVLSFRHSILSKK